MDYESLKAHLGHRVVVVSYGNPDVWNVTMECENCNEVLLDYDNPEAVAVRHAVWLNGMSALIDTIVEKHYGGSKEAE